MSFKRTDECNIKCRDPELGQCAPTAPADCGDREGRTSYRYNVAKQSCERVMKGAELSRCLRPPDLGRLRVGAKHYYYSIKDNKCLPTTHMAFWQTTSSKNRFPSFDECERTCKPKHQGTVKKLWHI
uniref:Putative salivary kunitz domain protein n=1 Tax=Ixodes ricinus TaxID=34613 RepID=A0A0K8RBW9_IXORI